MPKALGAPAFDDESFCAERHGYRWCEIIDVGGLEDK